MTLDYLWLFASALYMYHYCRLLIDYEHVRLVVFFELLGDSLELLLLNPSRIIFGLSCCWSSWVLMKHVVLA